MRPGIYLRLSSIYNVLGVAKRNVIHPHPATNIVVYTFAEGKIYAEYEHKWVKGSPVFISEKLYEKLNTTGVVFPRTTTTFPSEGADVQMIEPGWINDIFVYEENGEMFYEDIHDLERRWNKF